MKPILVFPPPQRDKVQTGQSKFARPPRTPGRRVQQRRLDRAFTSLSDYFHNVQVQETATGYEPEKTLVLQTAGDVQNVTRALQNLGLLVVTDVDGEDLEPDEDFWIEDRGRRTDKKIHSHFYLTMTNARGLEVLLAEWNRYKNDDDYQPRRGLGPLRQLFDQLHEIRFWSAEDRLRDTGLIDDWKLRVAHGDEVLPVEIELWHVFGDARQAERESNVRGRVQNVGGNIITQARIPEIGYHALLASVPARRVEQLLEQGNKEIELLNAEAISFFRPIGQCLPPDDEFSKPGEQMVADEDEIDASEPILDTPVVALLDGLPLENHLWLRDHLRVDDPDNFAEAYQPIYQTHGTAMASLIIHGDKNKENPPLSSSIYVRPILQPEVVHWDGHHHERVPESMLPVDLVHRAVQRMFEGENGKPPAAPSVRVINLSVGDASRLFDDHKMISPWAKLLDWLSWKYNVLFVVSAGNHTNDVTLEGIDNATFATMTPAAQRQALFSALHADMPNRRLYSPAESVNAITVGGLHSDEYDGPIHRTLMDIVDSDELPSPINPLSWGTQRSMKPEILMPAGRVLYQHRPYLDGDDVVLHVQQSSTHPPGQKVATPTMQLGNVNGFGYTCGTSNAAALATRQLALLRDTLTDLRGSEFGDQLTPAHETVLLKALLVHGAEVTQSYQGLTGLLTKRVPRLKAFLARFLGYGPVNTVRIRGCEENQATLVQSGTITTKHEQVLELPLPPCLNAKSHQRRLIITIAWLTPVNARSHNNYREVRLIYEPVTHFDPATNPLRVDYRSYDQNMPRKGTAIHEVLTGEQASPFIDGETLKIRIRCMSGPADENDAIPFGVVATLDSTDKSLPIYEEVKAAINVTHRARVKQSV